MLYYGLLLVALGMGGCVGNVDGRRDADLLGLPLSTSIVVGNVEFSNVRARANLGDDPGSVLTGGFDSGTVFAAFGTFVTEAISFALFMSPNQLEDFAGDIEEGLLAGTSSLDDAIPFTSDVFLGLENPEFARSAWVAILEGEIGVTPIPGSITLLPGGEVYQIQFDLSAPTASLIGIFGSTDRPEWLSELIEGIGEDLELHLEFEARLVEGGA